MGDKIGGEGLKMSIVEEIATRTATLPSELQHEILHFVEFVAGKGDRNKTKPFKSVRGILKRDMSNLDRDLAEVRSEMWTNFPCEDAK